MHDTTALRALLASTLALTCAAAQLPFRDFGQGLPGDTGSTAGIAVADFDGDGLLDVAVHAGNGIAPVVRAYRNDGFGGFDRLELRDAAARCHHLVAADLDGDGATDLVASHPVQGQFGMSWWRNTGRGTFATPVGIAPGAWSVLWQPYRFALGDLDGDGDLDVVVGSQDRRVLRNDGGGVFTSIGGFPFEFIGQQVFDLADYDHDGDVDALSFGNTTPAGFGLHVWHNDGGGQFALAAHVPCAVATDAVMVDVDGDGDRDVVGACPFAARDVLFVDDGTGTFTEVGGARMPGRSYRAARVTAGDVDGDGDPDLVVSSDVAAPVQWYANDGSGAFSVFGAVAPASAATWALALFDADADADLDLLLGNVSAPSLLLTNIERQQRAPGAVPIGATADFTFLAFPVAAGRATMAFPYLAGALLPLPVPVPGIGLLRLSPPLLPLPARVLDLNGMAQLLVPVPSDTGLVGATAFVQAAFAGGQGPIEVDFGNATATAIVLR